MTLLYKQGSTGNGVALQMALLYKNSQAMALLYKTRNETQPNEWETLTPVKDSPRRRHKSLEKRVRTRCQPRPRPPTDLW